MKHLFQLSLLLLTLFSFGQKQALNNIDKELNKLLKTADAPGFSVAIVKGQEIIYSKGFGYRDVENKIAADENTLYAIGSTSKAFTTAMLGQLREEGKLKFSDSPRKYIPELDFYSDEMNNTINIVDMMGHRTGLPRHDYSWYLFPVLEKDSMLSRVHYHEPFTGIREQWYYNNFMYLAQGVLAEKITGKTWEENIRDRFFAPLKMNRSNLDIDELRTHKNIAKGYSTDREGKQKKLDYFNISAMNPAGSINSSVKEMGNWLLTWVNDGKFNGEQIIPSKFVTEAVQPKMPISGSGTAEHPDLHLNAYGYAWFVSSYKGHYRAEHGGNIDGFSANVSFFPNDDIGIVVLVNQDGSAVPKYARNIISDHLLDVEKSDWNKELASKLKEYWASQAKAKAASADGKVANTSPSHSLIEMTGTYNHPGYGDFKVEYKNDSLFAHFVNLSFYLKHYHYDVFELLSYEDNEVDTTESNTLKFNFITSETGDIALAKIKFEPTLEALEFKRTPEVANVDTILLEQYTGNYNLSTVTISVSLKDEQLHMLVPGQPEYTLTALNNTEFVVKGLDGYKVRFEAVESTFNMVLLQPNGTFVCKKASE